MFPIVSAATAGLILIVQMLLAFTVSGSRGKFGAWMGEGQNETLQRVIGRHANLAENAGIFIVSFALLEMSGRSPIPLLYLCAAFLLVRISHAVGLSQVNTNNVFRLAGGIGTYLLGLLLGGLLVWVSIFSRSQN